MKHNLEGLNRDASLPWAESPEGIAANGVFHGPRPMSGSKF